jgi:ferredoxin
MIPIRSKIMKVLISYFSGTGNTRLVCDLIKDLLSKHGIVVEMASIEESVKFDNFDLLVVGGPIYAGNFPERLIRYIIRDIPRVEQRKAIVFSTSTGLINAHGVLSASSKLASKGFEVVLNKCFIMPRNFYFGSYSPMEDNYCKELVSSMKAQVIEFVETIIHGKYTSPPIHTKGILAKDLFAELFSVMAKFMGKSFRANENCTLCMKCVKNCPQENIIKKHDNIQFGFNCMMCTRCIHNCPANAIEYSGKIYKQYKLKNYLT